MPSKPRFGELGSCQTARPWKNKKDKIKRTVMYQPLAEGCLNFVNFFAAVKSLRLAGISRLLSTNLLLNLLCLMMTSQNVSHRSGSFVLVALFSADQAGQSSSPKAHQAQSRPTFPDGNVLPGTFEQVSFLI